MGNEFTEKFTVKSRNPDDVMEHMGVCEKHWKEGYRVKIVRGGHKRHKYPPSEFGDTPKSAPPHTTSSDLCIQKRGINSEERRKVTTSTSKKKDVIHSWGDFCSYYKKLLLAIQISDDNIRLVKLTHNQFFIDFSLFQLKKTKVKAYKGSSLVNVRTFIDSFHWKLILY